MWFKKKPKMYTEDEVNRRVEAILKKTNEVDIWLNQAEYKIESYYDLKSNMDIFTLQGKRVEYYENQPHFCYYAQIYSNSDREEVQKRYDRLMLERAKRV